MTDHIDTLETVVNNLRMLLDDPTVDVPAWLLRDAAALIDAQAERIKTLEGLLTIECAKLRAWARESREGGWSTHQVDPMLRRSDEIAAVIAKREGIYAVADSEGGEA